MPPRLSCQVVTNRIISHSIAWKRVPFNHRLIDVTSHIGDVQVEEEEEREGEGEDDASQLNDTLSQERNSYDRRGDEGASSQEAEKDEEEDYR